MVNKKIIFTIATVAFFISFLLVGNVHAELQNYCCSIKDGNNLKYKFFLLNDGDGPATKCGEGEADGVEIESIWEVNSPNECKGDTGVCCKTASDFGGTKTIKYNFESSQEICENNSDFVEIVELEEIICNTQPDEEIALPKVFGCCKMDSARNGKKSVAYIHVTSATDCNLNCSGGSADTCTYLAEVEKYECGAMVSKSEDMTVSDLIPSNTENLNQLNFKGSAGLPALIGNLISKALGVVGSIALAMFVYGGLLWMSSAGNAERQKKAVNVIVWASFGIIIILSSYVVVSFVFSVL